MPVTMNEPMKFTDELRDALLDSIPCAVFVLDEQQRVMYWNRSAEELTGYSSEEMLGASCESIQTRLHRAVDPEVRASLCPFSAGREQWDEQCEIRRRDGTIVPVVRKARPVLDEAGQRIGGVQTMMDVRFIEEARQQIQKLQEQVARLGRFGRLIGSSPEMRKLYEAVSMVAQTDAAVVIEGETGTGKELIARTIHETGLRREGPFLGVNCGALPEGLIEAELFGHVKGAFTGASADRPGRFEEAHGGTLLLDEVGELPLAAQVKLLRAVQEGEISRVGESGVRSVDVRIIAATNRDLRAEVDAGRFREDLFYRLRVVGLRVPPLRKRKGDLPELVAEFIHRLNEQYGRSVQRCDADAMRKLEQHDWPGNVRELQHAIEHAFVVSPQDAHVLSAESLPAEIGGPPASSTHQAESLPSPRSAMDEAEQVRVALQQAGGNKSQAARILGMTRAGLYKKMKRLGISLRSDDYI